MRADVPRCNCKLKFVLTHALSCSDDLIWRGGAHEHIDPIGSCESRSVSEWFVPCRPTGSPTGEVVSWRAPAADAQYQGPFSISQHHSAVSSGMHVDMHAVLFPAWIWDT